jgi:hypothetical protein
MVTTGQVSDLTRNAVNEFTDSTQRMPLFRYFSAESGLETLSTCELMVIPPKYLNDAFECSPVIRCKDPQGFTNAQLEEVTTSPEWFKRHQEHFPNVTFEQFQVVMKQNAKQLTEKLVADVPNVDLRLQRNALNIISAKFGVLSFTPNVVHPLMWGFYGELHAGIAIEFCENHQLFSGPSFLKVEYSNTPLVFDASDRNNRDDVELFLKRKSLEWSYECESRLIVQLSVTTIRDTRKGPRYFLPIDPELITSVTLGLRTVDSPATRMKILQVLDASHFQHVERFEIQKDVEAGALKRVRL